MGAECDTWYDDQQHGPNWRNVKNYGAKGDGVTDDTAALQAALTEGRTSKFTTEHHATVYIPPGTYVIRERLDMYFDTAVYGSWKCRPVILLAAGAAPDYALSATSDPTGEHTGNFYHLLQNVVLQMEGGGPGTVGIHWAVSQGSNMHNVTVYAGSSKSGIFIENGSPTQIEGLEIIGGVTPAMIGAQQYHMLGLTLSGNQYTTGPCLEIIWNWYMVIQQANISGCSVGVSFKGGASTSLVVLDSTFSDVDIAVETDWPSPVRGLLLDRVTTVRSSNVTNGLASNPSGTTFTRAWRQGYFFEHGQATPGGRGDFTPARANEPLPFTARPVLSGTVTNVLSMGAKGDGVTDDTAAFNKSLNSGSSIVFVPFGRYLLSSTITVPPGVSLIGDGQTVILPDPKSSAFADASNPQALIRTAPQYTGSIQDFMLATDSTNGDVPGCIMLQWSGLPGKSFLHDVYHRVYSTAWALVEVSPGAGGYMSSMWGWVADHDINSGASLTVKSPRGLLASAVKELSLYGVAFEHSSMYQFNITGSNGVTIIGAQTETPYWQVPPSAPGISITSSDNVILLGGGFYNWFNGVQKSLVDVRGC